MNWIPRCLKPILGRNRPGAALLLVIAVMVTLFILVSAALALVSQGIKADAYHQYEVESYDVANAGLQDGLEQLSQNLAAIGYYNSEAVQSFLTKSVDSASYSVSPVVTSNPTDAGYHLVNNRYIVTYKQDTGNLPLSPHQTVYVASVGIYGVNANSLTSPTDLASLAKDNDKHAIRTIVAKVTANYNGSIFQQLTVNSVSQCTTNDAAACISTISSSGGGSSGGGGGACAGQSCSADYWKQKLEVGLGTTLGDQTYNWLTSRNGTPDQWPAAVFTVLNYLGIK